MPAETLVDDASIGGGAPVEALAERLGCPLSDPQLLVLALTHRSWCAEHPGEPSNERLEFLGDAVLGLVVTDHIHSAYPAMPEGKLSKLRSVVVRQKTLAEVAASLGVGAALRLGKGEATAKGAGKDSILADAMEAIIGAVYLDAGFDEASRLVLEVFGEHIEREATAADGPGGNDAKTRLQEETARRFGLEPVYEWDATGPDHEKWFRATVRVGEELVGRGEGRSRKQAERAAAGDALNQLALLEHPANSA